MEAAKAGGQAHGTQIKYTFAANQILGDLGKKGFSVPSRASLMEAATAGLEPLTPMQARGTGRHRPLLMSCAHLINIGWQPIIEFINAVSTDEAPQWSEALAVNHAAILSEMVGVVPSPGECLDMDTWVQFFQETLVELVGVQVSNRMVVKFTHLVVPMHLLPTRANALIMVRSALCKSLLGNTLATQASRKALAKVAEEPVELLQEDALHLNIQKDLIDSLEAQHLGPELAESSDERPCKKARKDKVSCAENLKAKTDECVWLLENRVSVMRALDTLTSAATLLNTLRSSQETHAEDTLFGKSSLWRHLWRLDGALDRHTAEKVLDWREQGSFAGVALATYESPPKPASIQGLQVPDHGSLHWCICTLVIMGIIQSASNPKNISFDGHHALPQ